MKLPMEHRHTCVLKRKLDQKTLEKKKYKYIYFLLCLLSRLVTSSFMEERTISQEPSGTASNWLFSIMSLIKDAQHVFALCLFIHANEIVINYLNYTPVLP